MTLPIKYKEVIVGTTEDVGITIKFNDTPEAKDIVDKIIHNKIIGISSRGFTKQEIIDYNKEINNEI